MDSEMLPAHPMGGDMAGKKSGMVLEGVQLIKICSQVKQFMTRDPKGAELMRTNAPMMLVRARQKGSHLKSNALDVWGMDIISLYALNLQCAISAKKKAIWLLSVLLCVRGRCRCLDLETKAKAFMLWNCLNHKLFNYKQLG